MKRRLEKMSIPMAATLLCAACSGQPLNWWNNQTRPSPPAGDTAKSSPADDTAHGNIGLLTGGVGDAVIGRQPPKEQDSQHASDQVPKSWQRQIARQQQEIRQMQQDDTE